MKDRELRDYINDLTEACEDILSFKKGMSYSPHPCLNKRDYY